MQKDTSRDSDSKSSSKSHWKNPKCSKSQKLAACGSIYNRSPSLKELLSELKKKDYCSGLVHGIGEHHTVLIRLYCVKEKWCKFWYLCLLLSICGTPLNIPDSSWFWLRISCILWSFPSYHVDIWGHWNDSTCRYNVASCAKLHKIAIVVGC